MLPLIMKHSRSILSCVLQDHAPVYKCPVWRFCVFRSLVCDRLWCTGGFLYCAVKILCHLLSVWTAGCFSACLYQVVPCCRCTGGLVSPFESRSVWLFQNLDVLCHCDPTQCSKFHSGPAWCRLMTQMYSVNALSITELNKAIGLWKKY